MVFPPGPVGVPATGGAVAVGVEEVTGVDLVVVVLFALALPLAVLAVNLWIVPAQDRPLRLPGSPTTGSEPVSAL